MALYQSLTQCLCSLSMKCDDKLRDIRLRLFDVTNKVSIKTVDPYVEPPTPHKKGIF